MNRDDHDALDPPGGAAAAALRWQALHGVRPAGGVRCACRLRREGRGRHSYRHYERSGCYWAASGVLDHVTLWTAAGRAAVLVGQPYGGLAHWRPRAAEFARAHGLIFVGHARSFYNTGTVLLEFWAPWAYAALDVARRGRVWEAGAAGRVWQEQEAGVASRVWQEQEAGVAGPARRIE